MLYSKFYERFYSLRLKAANAFGDFFGFWPNLVYLSVIFLFQAASWWLSYYIFKNLTGNLLVLHYNVDFGIDWISDLNSIFYFPLLGLLFLFLSLVLIFIFGSGRHSRFESHCLMSGAALANLGMLAALTLVYIINFR
ncbi:MAG: hypothetical protein WCK59_02130 [Candidatus Falkowbacteria bacterium]